MSPQPHPRKDQYPEDTQVAPVVIERLVFDALLDKLDYVDQEVAVLCAEGSSEKEIIDELTQQLGRPFTYDDLEKSLRSIEEAASEDDEAAPGAELD